MPKNDFCIKPADILLPRLTDMRKWAVVACDQFTSQPEYWEELSESIGDSPSALNLIFPEAYFARGRDAEYIDNIKKNMYDYISKGLFKEYSDCFIYVERRTPFSDNIRQGIVCCCDLEQYSYNDSDKALIRATEGTVLSRIPPRLKIREGVPLEFPHVMLLFDDKEQCVMQAARDSAGKSLYDFALNMGGGSVAGHIIEDCEPVIAQFKMLLNPETLIKKYNTAERLLFTVGDGNHSLATAKAHWNTVKSGLSLEQAKVHPARYALVEAVNIHDNALTFEAIHRLVITDNAQKFIQGLTDLHSNGDHNAAVYFNKKKTPLSLHENAASAVGAVQDYIDGYLSANGGHVDYIHGEEALCRLCDRHGAAGIILPALKKQHLFEYVIQHGSMPRKTFSMGEAQEKRYYIEGRKIIL